MTLSFEEVMDLMKNPPLDPVIDMDYYRSKNWFVPEPILTRFFSKVKISDKIHPTLKTPCWEFIDVPDVNGYGRFRIEKKTYKSHRILLIWLYGFFPRSLAVDHLCESRICCNPLHLNVTTHQGNTLRSKIAPAAINSRKTICKKGHPLEGDNLSQAHLKKGKRICKTCKVEYFRKYYFEKQKPASKNKDKIDPALTNRVLNEQVE